MSAAKKRIAAAAAVVLGVVVLLALIFVCIYGSRLRTIWSIEQISFYDDGMDLYTMDVCYDYDLQDFIDRDINTDQQMSDALYEVALPLLPVPVTAPDGGCTAFQLTTTDGGQLMGRNYDFRKNTSAMLVRCAPKDGYRSIAFAALANVDANQPLSSLSDQLAALISPFLCLDGINEKGVSIAVLVVDSEPVHQDTEKGNIFTTLAIRLVLDRAATTQEAVELLAGYDMCASSSRDYHFYINDASGDGRIVEWDCESPTREMTAVPVEAATNFYTIYADKVLPNQHNGIYGHGMERYDAVMQVLAAQAGAHTETTAWDALKASSQQADAAVVTSNTQWSVVFDNTNRTVEIVIRRNWDDAFRFDTDGNAL